MTRPAAHSSRLTRLLAPVLAAATIIAGGLVAAAPAAAADPAPVAPETVTVDLLPTWQINGVVWSQAVVGTTVYVTGSFTKARPPGVAAGGAGEIDANNVFAFDITTGNPVAGSRTPSTPRDSSSAPLPTGEPSTSAATSPPSTARRVHTWPPSTSRRVR